MAGWASGLLAGVAGGLKGVQGQQRYDASQQQWVDEFKQKERFQQLQADVREMIARMGDDTKREKIKTDKDTADKKRESDATKAAASLESVDTYRKGNLALGAERNRLTDQNQQNEESWRYGSVDPRGWESLRLTDQGQHLTSADRNRAISATDARAAAGRATTERGQDISATTAAAGQAGASQRSRAGNVLDVLKLKAAAEKGASVFPPAPGAPAQKPDEWAAEFDRLYNDPNAMGGEAARAVSAAPPAAPVGAAPAPTAAPPIAPGRAPIPVQPRAPSSAVPAPAPAPQAAAPGADPRMALATQLVTLAKSIATMPPGPQREAAKQQLATLRQQAETLRTPPPGQD